MGNDGALVVDTSQIEKAKKTVVFAFPRVRKNHFERFYLVVGVAFILCTPIAFAKKQETTPTIPAIV